MKKHSTLFAGLAILAIAVPQPAFAQKIDFGDDASRWANDGECDDKRFVGPGMTSTPLLDEDVGHDATDCRTAYTRGALTLRNSSVPNNRRDSSSIYWGDDSSTWANDGECDDPRFTGPGMTSTPLLDEDIAADATDCRTAYEAGLLELR